MKFICCKSHRWCLPSDFITISVMCIALKGKEPGTNSLCCEINLFLVTSLGMNSPATYVQDYIVSGATPW